MARRAPTIDPVVTQLRREVENRLAARSTAAAPVDGERRRSGRLRVQVIARLVIGELALTGSIEELGSGGLFFRSDVLLEPGEHGLFSVDETQVPLPVRVAWNRSSLHAQGPGVGLAFEAPDAQTEHRVLALILALLDADPVA